MSDQSSTPEPAENARPKDQATPEPRPAAVDRLPQWKVVLHNDAANQFDDVVNILMRKTPLSLHEATLRAVQAEVHGTSTLLSTHLERAELFQTQLGAHNVTVTIERE